MLILLSVRSIKRLKDKMFCIIYLFKQCQNKWLHLMVHCVEQKIGKTGSESSYEDMLQNNCKLK